MAVIRITGLRLETTVGTNAWEQERRTSLPVDIEITYDAGPAAAGDDVAQAVDYEEVCNRVKAAVETRRFQLIETVARTVLDLIMADARVEAGRVRVHKPRAVPLADSVSVELSASR